MARNSIVARNKKLDKVIDSATSNKEKLFDKVLVTMIKNCIGKVIYHDAENVSLA